jgi:hypothetical protein
LLTTSEGTPIKLKPEKGSKHRGQKRCKAQTFIDATVCGVCFGMCLPRSSCVLISFGFIPALFSSVCHRITSGIVPVRMAGSRLRSSAANAIHFERREPRSPITRSINASSIVTLCIEKPSRSSVSRDFSRPLICSA